MKEKCVSEDAGIGDQRVEPKDVVAKNKGEKCAVDLFL